MNDAEQERQEASVVFCADCGLDYDRMNTVKRHGERYCLQCHADWTANERSMREFLAEMKFPSCDSKRDADTLDAALKLLAPAAQTQDGAK